MILVLANRPTIFLHSDLHRRRDPASQSLLLHHLLHPLLQYPIFGPFYDPLLLTPFLSAYHHRASFVPENLPKIDI